MPKQKRKMVFYEIGKNGNYANIMQRKFEQAQRICQDTNEPVTLESRITIRPPKNIGESFGQISFEIYPFLPHQKSMNNIIVFGLQKLNIKSDHRKHCHPEKQCRSTEVRRGRQKD